MSITPVIELGRMPRVEAMIKAVGPLEGRRVVDIGCGEGQIARVLAARGAIVQGYDPFITQSDWIDEGPGRFRLSHGEADAIPEPDGGADVVLFFLSLHHVPAAAMARALAEAKRLLKPEGVLCVIEPLAEGPGQYLSELFHDETAVRRMALAAVTTYAKPAFERGREIYFSEWQAPNTWEAFSALAIGNMRFNGYTEAAVLNPEVKRRFDEVQAAHAGGFDRRYRMNLFGSAQAPALQSETAPAV